MFEMSTNLGGEGTTTTPTKYVIWAILLLAGQQLIVVLGATVLLGNVVWPVWAVVGHGTRGYHGVTGGDNACTWTLVGRATRGWSIGGGLPTLN